MTQNIKTDLSFSPIVALAGTVLRHNGQLQQPFMRFLAWATGQIVLSGMPKVAQKILTQVYWIQSGKNRLEVISARGEAENLFPVRAAEIILDVLKAMEQTGNIAQLHALAARGISQISSEVLDRNQQTEDGISIATVFLMNQVGLKTIHLVLPSTSFKELMKRFYLDDKHPMDLQKLLRDPERSSKVGCVMSNLMKINARACPVTKHFAFLPMPFFNAFLATYVREIIQSMSPEKKKTNLLGVQTVDLNMGQLRESQESYCFSLGVSKQQINDLLQFSTPHEKKGIYLYPPLKIPEEMEDAEFLKTEQEVFLEVHDANHRVVVISKAGFQILEKLQLKMTQHLFQVMQKFNAFFPHYLVTGRVKSARSFLDKCGRLCEKTQMEPTDRCIAVTDIVDGCGVRITCASSSQIFAVIQMLRKEGFEFLELDNKYNTLRKDGAYKVIPCAMKDLATGLIFELQITTLASTTVADLFHNVIYKRNAIGLNPTDEEVGVVQAMQRLGALSETVSLVAEEPIVLTEKLKGETLLAALALLREMVDTVMHKQNAKL